MKRLFAVLLVLTVIVAAVAVSAADSKFPEKPIQLIVPFNPGGGSDVTARIVAEYMKPYLSQPVIVTNIDGAQGRTGELQVQKARPDGYSLVWQHQTMHMAYATGRSEYTWEAFTPVCNGCTAYSAVVVAGKSPFKNIKDLLAYLKANPKKMRLGVALNGTSHFALLGILDEAKIDPADVQLVPMSGDKDRIVATLGGMIDGSAITISSAAPYLASGDLKILGVMAPKRSKLYPQYPTLAESGIKAYNKFDYTVFAPKGLPNNVRNILAKAFKQALADPKCIEALGKQWTEPNYMSPSETVKLLKKDLAYFTMLADKYELVKK